MTDQAAETRAKKLETVRALLAKADGTNFPEEAEAFRAKANQLMTQFAIDQWMVDEAQGGVNARPKPEVRMMDFGWWYDSDHYSALWSMFLSVAHHCRCVVASRGQDYKQMPVIGIPSDLDYFDMLFTHLMLQMGRQLEPKPDPSKPMGENAYTLRVAGTNRVRVIKMLAEIDQLGDEAKEAFAAIAHRGRWGKLDPKLEKKLRVKVRVASERHAKDHGLDDTTSVTPKVWQRSFAIGFAHEVSDRLLAMREAEQRRNSDGPGVSLALRDIRQMAVELYDETWPNLCSGCKKPIDECECKCPKCGKLIRTECECPAKRSRAMTRQGPQLSGKALGAGRAAGAKADLSGSPQRGVGSQRELPR